MSTIQRGRVRPSDPSVSNWELLDRGAVGIGLLGRGAIGIGLNELTKE